MDTKFTIHCKRGRTKNRIFINYQEILPGPSLKLRNHSPDGFNWGYGGSGAAQAALAICLHIFESPRIAQALYQDFKAEYVAQWQEDDFTLEVDLTDYILDRWEHFKDIDNTSEKIA